MANIDALLGQMTLDEKVLMLSGSTAWTIPGCERLGVSAWTVSDGPIGVRGRGRAPALCMPSPSAWAATWDTVLIEEIGAAIAQEAKDRAVQLVLGPTVNIHRDPRGGRHFECYSEDPQLSADIARAYVEGLQAYRVGACMKHYVANDSEFERHSISSEVSERALREIYLPPFEAAVEAGVWSVMGAYNDVNGVQACEHVELIERILRDEWGFEGFVISDWYALKGTVAPAIGGTDIEMPGPGRHWGGTKLSDAVRAGEVPEADIDAKVRRILRFLDWAGGIGAELPDIEASNDRAEHRELALRVAAKGTVLLKNEGNLLPLDTTKLKRVAVLGPNARETTLLGGGSANVSPHHITTIVDALRERLEGEAELISVAVPTQVRRVRDFSSDVLGADGVTVEVFEGHHIGGESVIRTTVGRPLLNWTDATRPVAGDFAVRATCTFTPNEAGQWRLGVAARGTARLALDGEPLLDTREGYVNSSMEQVLAYGWRDLEAGRPYRVEVEYFATQSALGFAGFRFGGQPDPDDGSWIDESIEAARNADVAIVVTGTNTELESEGADRLDINLPADQVVLVEGVVAANPRTIVINNSGSPVLMPFADEVPAILQAWYPGQEGGDAIAAIIAGDLEPGGRMPTTWPKRLEDVPAFTSYPGEGGKLEYSEGVFVGYRWYDARLIEPLWAFGHGLSYTTFEWSEPEVLPLDDRNSDIMVRVKVDVQNTGDRAGSDVVQCYVAPIKPRLARPPQELRGGMALDLQPGESQFAMFELGVRDFSAWDPVAHKWVIDGERFEIRFGRSSRDIVSVVSVALP